jgi:3-keto-5-aminohexanoate cleavage enzyme
MGLHDNTIKWDKVARGMERAENRMIWKPYGLPEITNPSGSAFHDGEIQKKWNVSEKVIVQASITGAFYSKNGNPNQPITPKEIRDEARACLLEGASSVHIHVRDDKGYNTLSKERFEEVILPLRDEFPDLSVDGCMVTAIAGEWDAMKDCLNSHVLDGVPINTTAVFNGDALFAKPVPMMLEKTRLIMESGAAPIIAVYTDADVNNADRFLYQSGLLGPGQVWCILPGIPGCSPMETPHQMIDGLLRFKRLIDDVDPQAKMLVCSAGRASSYLVTAAALLGLHMRVGMEDTVWQWPHRDVKLKSNVDAVRQAMTIANALGRDVATQAEFRQIMGLPEKSIAFS